MDHIADDPAGTNTITGISRSLDIPKSSVHNICSELVSAGLLDRDDGTYRIGPAVVRYARSYLDGTGLVTQFERVCRELNSKVRDTVQLSVLNSGIEIVYAGLHRGKRYVTLQSDVGTILPANCTAMGKALLASLPLEELDRRLDEFGPLTGMTPNSITSRKHLIRELAQIRATGFAYDNDETLEGLSCIARSVRVRARHDGLAAISISFLSDRTDSSSRTQIERQVEMIASQLEAKVG